MSRLKKRIKNVAPGQPVFEYTSVCCAAHATKEPCARQASDKKENKFSECALGTWNCSKCSKKCTVKRSRVNNTQEVNNANPSGQ
jgi:hypothetical protein